jgi:predicted RNA methylase
VPKAIDADVRDILRTVTFRDNVAVLNCDLDRKTYQRVNKVFDALGGKWDRKAKGHIFEGSPEELLGDAVATGEYVDAKQQFQFFETPDWLADKIVALAGIDSGFVGRVLEPSAGGGRIVRAVNRAAPKSFVQAVELNPKLCDGLRCCADSVEIADFLDAHGVDFGESFDAVVMNPPFTRSQDIAHVRHAFEFLKPGGVLVAIMGIGWTFRQDRKATEFREWTWLNSVDGKWFENADNAFKESGTGVKTVTVKIQKAA